VVYILTKLYQNFVQSHVAKITNVRIWKVNLNIRGTKKPSVKSSTKTKRNGVIRNIKAMIPSLNKVINCGKHVPKHVINVMKCDTRMWKVNLNIRGTKKPIVRRSRKTQRNGAIRKIKAMIPFLKKVINCGKPVPKHVENVMKYDACRRCRRHRHPSLSLQ